MLVGYDARAVAEIMGLAFLHDPTAGCSPATRSGRANARSGSASGVKGDFVIHVDGVPVLVIEVRDISALPRTSKASRGNPPDAASRRVSKPSSVLIEKAVERGLPRTALRHVAERLSGGDASKVSALEWGVVPKTTLERRETQLSPQESERTERVARLFVHARRALGTEDEAREFMTTPHPELDGRSPLDAAKTDLGTRRTEQLLNALEYGLAL